MKIVIFAFVLMFSLPLVRLGLLVIALFVAGGLFHSYNTTQDMNTCEINHSHDVCFQLFNR